MGFGRKYSEAVGKQDGIWEKIFGGCGEIGWYFGGNIGRL